MIKKLLSALLFIATTTNIFGQGSVSQPNVLFISIDDLKPTIKAYGDTYAQTPQMDAIAALGTVFKNNQCQWAVCGPSRSSLMTGKRPDYTQVWDLKTLIRTANPNIVTLPQYFKSKGYDVRGGGKIYDTRSVTDSDDANSWSTTFVKPNKMDYGSYTYPDTGHYATQDKRDSIALLGTSVYKPLIEVGEDTNGVTLADNAYNDGAMADEAIDMIDAFVADGTKPFFLAAGFKNPHLPFTCPKKYFDLYDVNNAPLASYTGRGINIDDIALKGSGELASYPTPYIPISQASDGEYTISTTNQKELIRAYYACTSYVDTQIGKIIAKLKTENLDSKTIVIIWSDHGFHLGDHNMWGKHSNMENATFSPMIIYDPRNPSGNETTQPTELLDIFPTLCDMAGLDIPNDMDGKSLKPLLSAPTVGVKDYAISQFQSQNKYGYSFKNEQYRYTVWLDNDKKATDSPTSADYFEQEIYDYVNDVNETTNYFGDANYSAIQATMVKDAQDWFDNGGGIVSPSSSATSVDVVLNGDFEDTTYDSNWTFTVTGSAAAIMSDAAGDANGGTKGAKIVVTTADADNKVRLQNEKYTTDLSGKKIVFKVNAKGSGNSEKFKIRVYQKANGATSYPASSYFNLTNTYQEFSHEVILAANTTEFRFDLLVGGTDGTYYFDDISTTSETLSTDRIEVPYSEFGIFPNPTSGILTFKTDLDIKSAKVIDTYGQEVYSTDVFTNKIDLSNLAKGIYFISAKTKDNKFITRKVILTK
ncbi:sulfatase-like hydrolase/transferase [Flavobacteriaceae bacterium]|nr:sulfatase-like hydrolase/transferase [Flavobacteriaceae bacterium]